MLAIIPGVAATVIAWATIPRTRFDDASGQSK
jgi:hypothetical protein